MTGAGPACTDVRRRTSLAVGIFAGSALVALLLEHRAHVLGAWPLLFVLLCLGAHLLMHRGHGGSHGCDHRGGHAGRRVRGR